MRKVTLLLSLLFAIGTVEAANFTKIDENVAIALAKFRSDALTQNAELIDVADVSYLYESNPRSADRLYVDGQYHFYTGTVDSFFNNVFGTATLIANPEHKRSLIPNFTFKNRDEVVSDLIKLQPGDRFVFICKCNGPKSIDGGKVNLLIFNSCNTIGATHRELLRSIETNKVLLNSDIKLNKLPKHGWLMEEAILVSRSLPKNVSMKCNSTPFLCRDALIKAGYDERYTDLVDNPSPNAKKHLEKLK